MVLLIVKSLENNNDVFDSIRNKINEIDDNKYDYGVDYNKIKFSSDDDLPLNKLLKFSIMTITIRYGW